MPQWENAGFGDASTALWSPDEKYSNPHTPFFHRKAAAQANSPKQAHGWSLSTLLREKITPFKETPIARRMPLLNDQSRMADCRIGNSHCDMSTSAPDSVDRSFRERECSWKTIAEQAPFRLLQNIDRPASSRRYTREPKRAAGPIATDAATGERRRSGTRIPILLPSSSAKPRFINGMDKAARMDRGLLSLPIMSLDAVIRWCFKPMGSTRMNFDRWGLFYSDGRPANGGARNAGATSRGDSECPLPSYQRRKKWRRSAGAMSQLSNNWTRKINRFWQGGIIGFSRTGVRPDTLLHARSILPQPR